MSVDRRRKGGERQKVEKRVRKEEKERRKERKSGKKKVSSFFFFYIPSKILNERALDGKGCFPCHIVHTIQAVHMSGRNMHSFRHFLT